MGEPTVAVVAQLAVRRGRAAVAAAALQSAVAAGAREVAPVSDGHGWRLGPIADSFGTHWEVGKPLVPWPPAGH